MAEKGDEFDLDHLRELMRAMSELDIHELQLKLAEDREIVLKRHPPAPLPPPPPPAPNITVAAPMTTTAGPLLSSAPPAASQPPAAPAEPAGEFITSPFVGTFYRASSPGSAPFMQVGDTFKAGDTLCIVEAMKLMNEIEAEFDGEILEILGENGKPVEYGDRIFRVAKR